MILALAAILIGGGLAAPAEARQQHPEAEAANAFIALCFKDGGDPVVWTYDDGSVIVSCVGLLPGGGTFVCKYVGQSSFCFSKVTPAGDLTVPEPGEHALAPAAEEPAPVGSPTVTATEASQDDAQVHESKKKKKQVKKTKKGNGKAKQRGKGRGGR